MKDLKGDLLCKNNFYKMFEHSCVAAVCENNQPIMGKIHPFIFLNNPNKSKSLRTSNSRFSLCTHHRREKFPPFCDDLYPNSIDIDTALSEKLQSAITGDIYNVSTKGAMQVLCILMHQRTWRYRQSPLYV